MSGAIDFQSFVQGQAMTSDQQEQVRLATAALDTFTEAFNACDLALVDQALHFPHVMLSGSETLIWSEPGQHPSDFFARLQATGWHRTAYESRQAVWVTQDKVHFVVVYTRRDVQDQVLSLHTNLWVVTCKQGRWAVALRSY